MNDYNSILVTILQNKMIEAKNLYVLETIEHNCIIKDMMWEAYHDAKHLKDLVHERIKDAEPLQHKQMQDMWADMERLFK